MTMMVDGVAIGRCLYGTEVAINDYSRKDRDEFGAITLIQRGYSDLVNYRVSIPTSTVAAVRSLLASKRAVSAVYVGATGTDVLTVTGYLVTFSIVYEDWQRSSLTLQVEGETHG